MFYAGIGRNNIFQAATFDEQSNADNKAMKGMTNISVNTRMKQFLVLIILILAGILFALSAQSLDDQPSNQDKLKADVTGPFK